MIKGIFRHGIFKSGLASVDYLLDTYPATAAYSVRLLSSTYFGSCLRVRRDSDNAEQDIGFVAGWLDEGAITTFCGASNGYVVTWYDQSEGGYDAIMTTSTRQPQIYNGSVILTDNGKPSLTKVDTSTALSNDTLGTHSQPNTIFTVGKLNSSNNGRLYDNQLGNGDDQALYVSSNTIRMYAGNQISAAGTGNTDAQTLFTTLFNTTTSLCRANGNQIISGDVSTDSLIGITLMNRSTSNIAADSMQSCIVYSDDQTANFDAIEAIINTDFGVY